MTSLYRINFDYFRNIRLLFDFSKYIPDYEIVEITELSKILNTKKRGIIFDVDQTLISYRDSRISDKMCIELNLLKEEYKCCLLSNYRKNESQTIRLKKISEQINIPLVLTNNKKPSPLAFQAALATLNLNATEVIMVGDRIITDMVGANNQQITSVLIKPIEMWADQFLLVTIPRFIELFLLNIIKFSIKMDKFIRFTPDCRLMFLFFYLLK